MIDWEPIDGLGISIHGRSILWLLLVVLRGGTGLIMRTATGQSALTSGSTAQW